MRRHRNERARNPKPTLERTSARAWALFRVGRYFIRKSSRFVFVETGYERTKMGAFIPCLLVAPASHGAGKAGAAATGEGQATETSVDRALGDRIKDALGKEPVLRDATNLSVMARRVKSR
jgi:hypothetical protein